MLVEGNPICGIFGAIGKNWNLGTLRALAIANRERGTDSLGFFDSSGKMIKCADDPSTALRKENITNWLQASAFGSAKLGRPIPSWFIAGHTRLATRGKVNRQNSHPFRYGRIIGAHNGMIDAPTGYAVDSQYLFDALNKSEGDYNKAWAKVTGYWGISWFDDKALWLQVHNGDLTVCSDGPGLWYYSSSWTHLETCIGYHKGSITLKEGQTLKFSEGPTGAIVMEEATKFESAAPEYWAKRYGCSNAYENWDKHTSTDGKSYYTPKQHGRMSKAYTEGTSDSLLGSTAVRDYDSEWRDAWESYCGESEHDKV